MPAGLFRTLFPSREAALLDCVRREAWQDWLVPLGDGGVGSDPGYEDAFFTLKDEVTRLSGTDDAKVVELCAQILKTAGKDLRVAGYYAWARLRQDGPAGFAQGLELVASLIETFGEALWPERVEAKKGALEWLASIRVFDLLDIRGEFASADLERFAAALDAILAQTAGWSEAAQPNLNPLVSRFMKREAPPQAGEVARIALTPASSAMQTAAIASARDMLECARVMTGWLRAQENGYLPSVRLARTVRWDTLHEAPPADGASRTRLAPPRAELRQQLNRLVLQRQWHELLERVESSFMEGMNHLWFDLQCFQHMALDHAGAPYDGWRDLLRADFALFLERLPGIERLAFNDGTPFADDATLEWSARYAVARDLAAGESVAPLAVSADSESDAVGGWPEIETQARELASREGIEAAFAWLEALPGLKTARHRYLQRLVMARLAGQSGRLDVALALLAELDSAARSLVLVNWEPALVFEVRQQLVHTLKAMSTRKDADKPALARRMSELQAELTVLDPARALTLSPQL